MPIQPSAERTIAKMDFLNSVVNKIGKQTYSSQAFVNPLVRFKGEFIEAASDIEEIYVERAEDIGADDTGAGSLDRKKPTVYTQYHSYEVEHGYAKSVSTKQMRKGFTSNGGIQTMADAIVQSLHSGYNIDEYEDILDTLKALVGAKKVGNTIKVPKVVDEATAKRFCKEVKKVIPKMAVWNNVYSAKPNFAPTNRLVLFIDSDVDVEVSTEYLASLFNMTVAQLKDTTKIEVPNLKTILGNGDFAVMCDERCLKINPTYYGIESDRNIRGKFTNYDLSTSMILSYTDWFQFVVFEEEAA